MGRMKQEGARNQARKQADGIRDYTGGLWLNLVLEEALWLGVWVGKGVVGMCRRCLFLCVE
jgi:hypothetical protein